MDIDSGALRALLALADERHFGRAAARLGITQQAVSKRIQRLETRLGTAVVDRTDRRGVQLTAFGERLLDPARVVIEAVDSFSSAVGGTTRFRIDVLDEHLLPMSRAAGAARGTGLTIEPVTRPESTTAEHLLLTGQADASFGRAGAVGMAGAPRRAGAPGTASAPGRAGAAGRADAPGRADAKALPGGWPEGVERRLVLLEPLSVLLPVGHPWARLDSLPLGALRGESLWFPMSGAPREWREYLAELARVAGIRIDTTGATFGYQQWGGRVAEGLAPPSIIGEEMPPPGGVPLAAVPIVDPTPVFPWSLLWRRDLAPERLEVLLGALGVTQEPRVGDDVWLPASDARLHR